MKKVRVLSVLFTIMFIGSVFTGCSNGSSSSSDEDKKKGTDTEAGTGEGGSTDTGTDTGTDTEATITAAKIAEWQTALNGTAATITLTEGTVPAGSKLTISRAVTVDGKGISGLTLEIASNVTNSVTLKNFKNAGLKVTKASSSTANNNVRSVKGGAEPEPPEGAEGPEAPDVHFKKFGEDSLPLHIEGCEIKRLEAEEDFALYVENGDEKKSEIKELMLKEGVEDFTFIELDKEDTDLKDKTKVEDLIIEDGVEKINLIGGTFDDVNLADDFSGKVDFKYDKEFDDQFGDDFDKEAFFGKSVIEEKDVAVVELGNTSAAGSGVYKFQIPTDLYAQFDGLYTVIFMTDEQATNLAAAGGSFSIPSTVASIEHPVYAALPTGTFKIDFEGDKSKPLTIFGSEGGYIDYGAAHARGLSYYEKEDIVVLENYRNYNKEAFIAEVGNDNVTIYVNMAAIRKNDIVGCAWLEVGEYGEAGSKMAEISLEGYKPYISLNWGEYRQNYEIAHPQPQSPEINPELFNNYRDETGNVNWESFANDYPNEYALLEVFWDASEAWEPTYNESRNFALENAIKSSDPMANTGMPVDMMIPYGNALKLSNNDISFTFTPMTTSTSYPDVSNVTPTVKKVEGFNIYQDMLDNWQD